MARPSVDVVVPFRGAPAELEEVRAALGALALAAGDSVLVVDNTPGRAPAELSPAEFAPAALSPDGDGVAVLRACEVETPGYARNRGAALGRAEWLVFIDADTVPSPDLLDRYFDPLPGERTALLAGGVLDEAVPPRGRAVPRYAHISGAMSQENTLRCGEWAFPQTANAACRRAPFEAADGFREDIRAAEDADLTFRLKHAGWGFERRDSATVVHRSRQTLRDFVLQKAGHGAGAAWLDREHPGSFPPRRRPGLLWWGVRRATRGLLRAAWSRDRDEALWAVLDPLEQLSYELGRSLRNERPLAPGRARVRP